jgi:hypothetical protein
MAMRWAGERPVPRPMATAGFALASVVAGLLAWKQFFQGTRAATWEPTRRPA